MYSYIEAQIFNMKNMTKTFEQSCKMAAIKNDGKIDRDEERILKKINAATQRFLRDLENIK